jgi:erythronate-4-phosphate dehydrogenase
MKILADENIVKVAEYFGWAGELVTMPGRAIDAKALQDVDALLVRSITRVDGSLLAGSHCRFVGTATSGIDHVDIEWLQKRGIGFGSAPGCNANSVVEYLFSVLAALSERQGFDWRALTYGIVGCGQIGGLLAQRLQSLQIHFVIHDPFLDERHPMSGCFADLDTVLQQEVVTLHTPLTRDTAWPTWHLLNERKLARMKPATILINAARGAIVDNRALLARLEQHPEQLAVLDAWEGEPNIDLALLRRVALGTPHIAGYSYEGKLNGTKMLAESFCRYFGLQSAATNSTRADAASLTHLHIPRNLTPLAQLNQLLLQAYDVRRDHVAMQELLRSAEPGQLFDRLRKNYPVRPEFSRFLVTAAETTPAVVAQAKVLGFRIQA